MTDDPQERPPGAAGAPEAGTDDFEIRESIDLGAVAQWVGLAALSGVTGNISHDLVLRGYRRIRARRQDDAATRPQEQAVQLAKLAAALRWHEAGLPIRQNTRLTFGEVRSRCLPDGTWELELACEYGTADVVMPGGDRAGSDLLVTLHYAKTADEFRRAITRSPGPRETDP